MLILMEELSLKVSNLQIIILGKLPSTTMHCTLELKLREYQPPSYVSP